MEIDPRLREPPLPATAGSVYPQLQQRPGPPSGIPIAANPSVRLPPPPPPPQQQQQQHHQHHYHQPHHDAAALSVYPPPPTPQSVGSISNSDHHLHDGGVGSPEGPNDPKRPRACEACRGLKVRCEPDPNNPDGPCKRCAKANRNCIVTVPSRKRQKKTDSRVAELEKKIDALTASLQAQKQGGPHSSPPESRDSPLSRPNTYEQVTSGSYGYPSRPDVRVGSGASEWLSDRFSKTPSESDLRRPAPPSMVMAGQKRKHDSRSEGNTPASTSSGPSPAYREPEPPAATPRTRSNEYDDVIDRGIISMEMAVYMFNRYVKDMAPQMPAVIFPEGTTAAEVRKNKPTLFLAILSASSGTTNPDIQLTLTKEVMQVYADRIICRGEKTLELVQALQVSTLWYWPPEHFEELKFYQLIHISAVMAIDIGLGKRSKSKGPKQGVAGLWRDHPWRKVPFPDPDAPEARRAWLSIYFMCCNASMGLRRPNLIRWTPYMADCIDVLENSPDAVPSDKILCQWVKSQHIAEDIGTQFSMDDPFAAISIADSKVQFALKGFERDLENWSNNIPRDIKDPTLKMTEHVVNLYMHEVAMHVDHNVEEFKPPFTTEILRGDEHKQPDLLTSSHISALSICLSSIDGIIETFLSLEVEVIRALPIFHFVRVAYAVVVLIKMYFAAATPGSELGKVIQKDNMKVEQYLDGLLEIFKAASADDKSRPGSKFLLVLVMLKTWFMRQRESRFSPKGVEQNGQKPKAPTDGSMNGQHPLPNQPEFTPNTPLQLLSEVATGNTRPGANHSPYNGAHNGEWQNGVTSAGVNQSGAVVTAPPQGPHPTTSGPYSAYNEAVVQGNPHAIYNMGVNPNSGQGDMGGMDPSMGMGLEYTMGDGFEQAMGLTMGDSYFGKYLTDDAFFGAMMENMGGSANIFEGF